MARARLVAADVHTEDGLALSQEVRAAQRALEESEHKFWLIRPEAVEGADVPNAAQKSGLIQSNSVDEADYAALRSHVEVARSHYREARAFQQARDDALFRMCYSAGDCLAYVDENPHQFDRLCREGNARGDFSETRLVDLISKDDDGNSTVSTERRADYAAAIRWMRTPEINRGDLDMEPVIAAARRKRGIAAIAEEYRDWATKNLPPGSFGVRTEQDQQAREAKKAQQAHAAKTALAGLKVRIGKHPVNLSAFSEDAQKQVAGKLAPDQDDDDLIDEDEDDEVKIEVDNTGLDSKDREWLSMSDLIDFVDMQFVNVESMHNFEDILCVIGGDKHFLANVLIRKRPGYAPDIFGPTRDHALIRRVVRQIKKESAK